MEKNTSATNEDAITIDEAQRLVERMVGRTTVLLWYERLWPSVLTILAPVFIVALAALYGVFDALPPLWHWGVLIVAAGLTGFTVKKELDRFSQPTRLQALQRLELDSALPANALNALYDTPVNADADDPFWCAHMDKIKNAAARAQLRKPISAIDQRDPFSMRYGALGLLLLGLAIAGPQWSPRLSAAFMPPALLSRAPVTADLWLEPPDYTGLPPVQLLSAGALTSGLRDQINVPVGSTANAQTSSSHKATLTFATTEEKRTADTAGNEEAGGPKRYRMPITESGALIFSVGGKKGVWPIGTVKDLPPTIAAITEPAIRDDGLIIIGATLLDDFGLQQGRLIMRLDASQARPLDAPAIDNDAAQTERAILIDRFPLPSGDHRFTIDLRNHPWAGLSVIASLEISDGAGQRTRSEPFSLTLPSRAFYNPLAKAVIEQRQNMAITPHAWKRTGRSLDALTFAPEYFDTDIGEYLMLRSAYHRVMRRGKYETETTIDEFLPLALQLEDEGLELARQQLQAAQDALREALANNASQNDINRKIAELKKAMENYIAALAQSGQAQAQAAPHSTQQLTSDDLDQQLQSIQDLSKSGARQAAEQALSELQNMLDNLQIQQSAQGQSGTEGNPSSGGQMPMPEGTTSGAAQTSALIGEQRDLANRTFDQMRETPADQAGSDSLADQQQTLSEALSDLQNGLPQSALQNGVGDQFDDAARAMRRAQSALSNGDLAGAAGAMENAIESLRDGAQQLARAERSTDGKGQGFSEDENGTPLLDPLGRPIAGAADGSQTDVPGAIDAQRAREILLQLRKRLSDGERSSEEIEYLERLLERF